MTFGLLLHPGTSFPLNLSNMRWRASHPRLNLLNAHSNEGRSVMLVFLRQSLYATNAFAKYSIPNSRALLISQTSILHLFLDYSKSSRLYQSSLIRVQEQCTRIQAEQMKRRTTSGNQLVIRLSKASVQRLNKNNNFEQPPSRLSSLWLLTTC